MGAGKGQGLLLEEGGGGTGHRMLLLTEEAGHRQPHLVPQQGHFHRRLPQGQGSRLPAAANWNTVRSTITGLRHTGQRKAMERLASSIMGTTSVEF